MFFRTKMVRGTPVVQLVESFRNPEGLPRQRVLASLGDASVPVDERGAIAKAVELRLLDWQRLKNMMGILLVALYFLSVHLGEGLRLEILAGHNVTASKRFYGVTEFCYYALADGVGALLSRISPRKAKPPPKNNAQELLPGFL